MKRTQNIRQTITFLCTKGKKCLLQAITIVIILPNSRCVTWLCRNIIRCAINYRGMRGWPKFMHTRVNTRLLTLEMNNDYCTLYLIYVIFMTKYGTCLGVIGIRTTTFISDFVSWAHILHIFYNLIRCIDLDNLVISASSNYKNFLAS